MKTNPKISVCISFYNNSNYIKECLESVICQTYKNFEIVIFNDGSDSLEVKRLNQIIQLLKLKVNIINSVNVGRLAARLNLYKECDGDIIFTLDSDDYISETNAFDKIIKEFVNKGVDCVLFNCTRSDRRQNYIDYSALVITNGKVLIENLKSYFCTSDQSSSLCLKAFSKSLISFDINQLSKKLNMAEDRYLFAHILDNITTCSLINEPLYFYRLNFSSVMLDDFNLDNFRSSIFVEKFISDCAQKWCVEKYDYCSYVYHYIIYNAINRIAVSKFNKLKKIQLIYNIRNFHEVSSVLCENINYCSFFEKFICKLFVWSKFRIIFMLIWFKNIIKKRIKNEQR